MENETTPSLGAHPKTRGLGRGLNALFEDEEVAASPVDAVQSVSAGPQGRARGMMGLDQLAPGQAQPRRRFPEKSLEELAASIQKHGVLQPLLVRKKDGAEDRFEIIAGERRWRAAQLAQVHEVPVIVLDIPDVVAFEIALIENLQREDLDPIDEAAGFQRLMELYNYTQEKLAESLGKSRPHIANMLRLLQLPEAVQGHLREKKITIGHARALISVPYADVLAEEIIAKGLSVRATEKLVSEWEHRPAKASKSPRDESLRMSDAELGMPSGAGPKGKDVNTIALEDHVSGALGMRVHIDAQGGGAGVLRIEFKTFDQLDDVLHRLSHFPGSRLNG